MVLESLKVALYVIEIVLGLGFVIFVHELGHFLMAKRHGVRVDAFSLGMGPILWKKFWKGTEYRLSAIPLGGYVKMAGENIGDPRTGAEDELTSKSAWQRLQIFSAGVIMNLLFAFPIAILAFLLGRSQHDPQVAALCQPEAEAGLRPGAVILEVDGQAIESFEQYRREILRRPEGMLVPVKFRQRKPDGSGDETLERKIRQSGSEVHQRTSPAVTTLLDVKRDSPAWKAGLRPKDVIREIDGREMVSYHQVSEALKRPSGSPVKISVTRDGKALEPIVLELPTKTSIVWPEDNRMVEAAVGRVEPGEPADLQIDKRPFLEKGDVIREIDGRSIRHYQDLKDAVEPAAGRSVTVTRFREGGGAATAKLVPSSGMRLKGQIGIAIQKTAKVAAVADDSYYRSQGLESGDEILSIDGVSGEVGVQDIFLPREGPKEIVVAVMRQGARREFKVAGREERVADLATAGFDFQQGLVPMAGNMFFRRWGFGEAVSDGLYEPIDIIVLTFQLMKKLFVAEESTKGLAGPVGIVKFSYSQAEVGLGNLLWMMCLITVNLGIFNILPVPVLDGGHVLLLAIEKIRRRPPSPAFIEKFQLFGLVLLLSLIVFVTYNDIVR